MADELARALNDAAVALRDVAADLLDLKAAIERRSLSVPVEERGPGEPEPLRPENPDEEAPDGRDCTASRGRPDEPLDFGIDSRRDLMVGDRLRLWSHYRGELARWRIVEYDYGRDELTLRGEPVDDEPVTDE